MRKTLLAGVAMFGLVLAAPDAHAQSYDDQTSTDDGDTVAPTPAPGTVAVHLNGRLRAYVGVWDDQQFNRSGSTTAITYAPTVKNCVGACTFTGTATTTFSENKQSNYGAAEYFRLYPGFDGQSASGILYGATAEIRQDNLVAPGGGANGSVSGSNRAANALYVRRDWGYIGTAPLGTLRFGTEDSAQSLFLTGTFENFNDGGWNGDIWYQFATNAQISWPFADNGNYYATNKIIYLSPRFAGLDVGVSWEPSSAPGNIDDGNCAFANTASTFTVTGGAGGTVPADSGNAVGGVGCYRLSSTTNNAESQRRKNTFDAVLRYRATFDGVGIVATGGYTGGGHVSYSGPEFVSVGGVGVRQNKYQDLAIGDVGLVATFGGLQVGGNYQFGRQNDGPASGGAASFSPLPQGGKDAGFWIAGASYTIGPVILGAAYMDFHSQGAFQYNPKGGFGVDPTLGQRDEKGVQAGGTLKVAPGLGVFLSYLWDERRQHGYDFVAGGFNDTLKETVGTNNQVRAQAATVGTSLTW